MSLDHAVAEARATLAGIREVKHKLIGKQVALTQRLMAASRAKSRGVRYGSPTSARTCSIDHLNRAIIESRLNIEDCMARETIILDALRRNGCTIQ